MGNLLLFRFSSTAAWWLMAIAAYHCLIPPGAVNAENLDQFSFDGIYNDNEERRSFDLIMQPYPIPIQTTTYVDFVFNLPEDTPDLFHVVYGEVINSQPLHLHHFVITGCARTFDPSQEGVPIDSSDLDDDCTIQLGGWAPGSSVFGNVDMDVGQLMGRGLKVQSVRLNVHYTSGKYEDEENQIFKMATDGIRIHYTPTFRPYTSMAKSLLSIGAGPKELAIPPNQSRFYITRTCNVEHSCTDAQDDLQFLVAIAGDRIATALPPGMSLSSFACTNAIPFCGLDNKLGQIIRNTCPASCGFCEEVKENGEPNPLVRDQYRLTAINYHAHLLGREMYTTLLREGAGNDGKVEIDAIDLKSKQIWIFDDQGVYPFDFNDNDTSNRRGIDVIPGDKIQVTCIYNSEERTDTTIFGLSTFDEMCITTAYFTFETPTSLMTNNGNIEMASDLITELSLMTFRCKMDDEGSLHTGVLEADEDPRDIWKDHPLEDSQGCTFPVLEGVGGELNSGAAVLFSNNCDNDDETICPSGTTLMLDVIAGHLCSGGTKDGTTSWEGTKESDCVQGGGEYNPYNCEDTSNYFLYFAQADGLLQAEINNMVSSIYQPICCKGAQLPVTDGPDLPGTGEDPKEEDPKEEAPKDQKPEDKPDPEGSKNNSAATSLCFEKSSGVLALGLLLYHLACIW